MLVIDNAFVQKWEKRYDDIFANSYDQSEEQAIRDW